MSKIFITGSADGLGLLSAQALVKRGHAVYLHARNAARAEDAKKSCPDAAGCFIADLSSAAETKSLASQLNKEGSWDAIVHNAGVMRNSSGGGVKTDDGRKLSTTFAVNTLAPYLLTSLVDPPAKRIVFLSSGMHQGGDESLRDIEQSGYGDTKLHNVMLAFWFARNLGRGNVASNSMDPGWVATKMGGANAPDDIGAAVETYVMLAEGTGKAEGQTGKYWYQGREKNCKSAAQDEKQQDKLIELLRGISGVNPPE